MSTKHIIYKFLRKVGYQIIKHRPDWELRPKISNSIDILPLAIEWWIASRKPFFFIQVGANDGIRRDPLRPLILKYHLTGLLIEPLPDFFEELKSNYSSEKQLLFENAAVVAQDCNQVNLFRFHHDAPIPDAMHGRATLIEQIIRDKADDMGLEKYVEMISVNGITFNGLLKKHAIKKLELLQIDAEGFDLEIIKMAFDADIYPEMINYEFIHLSDNERIEGLQLLAMHGYKIVEGDTDTFAMRSKSDL